MLPMEVLSLLTALHYHSPIYNCLVIFNGGWFGSRCWCHPHVNSGRVSAMDSCMTVHCINKHGSSGSVFFLPATVCGLHWACPRPTAFSVEWSLAQLFQVLVGNYRDIAYIDNLQPPHKCRESFHVERGGLAGSCRAGCSHLVLLDSSVELILVFYYILGTFMIFFPHATFDVNSVGMIWCPLNLWFTVWLYAHILFMCQFLRYLYPSPLHMFSVVLYPL